MSKLKKNITNKKERVVLSDTLPFETPATFSNRYFYDFLISNKIELCENKITWNAKSLALSTIIKLIFGIKAKDIVQEIEGEITLNMKRGALKAIPFHYKISHKHKEFRELTVVHPKSQLAVIEFYNKYNELIVYYSNESDFSLRRPFKTAQFTYFKDRLHYEKLAADHELVGAEEFDKEYEHLKTFFSYKEISNIHKFYESYKYHRCEKKFKKLFKFDISKCFDSIYSHSISWAILNKDIVKDNISLSNATFGGEFDRLMQDLNYGETNGIVIGPEFSRIFAEIILQQIDKKVKLELSNFDDDPLIFRRDYELFRYVDDYFIFYNNDEIKDEILRLFRLHLRDYKLGLNEEKSQEYSMPILTGITIAKVNVVKLLDKALSFKIKNPINVSIQDEAPERTIFFSSNNLITEFKIIIKSAEIKYKDIQNFTLGCLDNKVITFINLCTEENLTENEITKSCLEILDFSFFVYTVTPRVNSTIKLCSILSKMIQYVKLHLNSDFKDQVLKKIYDEVFLVLKKSRMEEHIQIETLYLLITLKELGKDYRLDEKLLAYYMGIDLIEKRCKFSFHYFTITVLLFYIGDKKRYKNLKKTLENYIINKVENIAIENRTSNTELIMLFFDILSCPYVERRFQNKLFILFGIPSTKGILRSEIINSRKYWFTKWDNFNFGKELEAKKSQEVY